jgi:hypothetical protein
VGFEFVADADFLHHPEDTWTNIVFKNPTPNDEFVLKFCRPWRGLFSSGIT